MKSGPKKQLTTPSNLKIRVARGDRWYLNGRDQVWIDAYKEVGVLLLSISLLKKYTTSHVWW